MLGRHGLIAWGDTAKACYDNLHLLINRALRFIADRRGTQVPPSAEIKIAAPPAARRRELARAILPALRGRLSRERAVILHYDDSPEALAFAGAARAGALAARGMSTPEHILRCGRVPLYVDADLSALPPAHANDAIGARARSVRRALPRDLRALGTEGRHARAGAAGGALPGLGLVTAMKDKANAVVGNLCYRHVIRVAEAAEALGGFRFLDEADAIEFEYWPLELAKLKQAERELSRQVARSPAPPAASAAPSPSASPPKGRTWC